MADSKFAKSRLYSSEAGRWPASVVPVLPHEILNNKRSWGRAWLAYLIKSRAHRDDGAAQHTSRRSSIGGDTPDSEDANLSANTPTGDGPSPASTQSLFLTSCLQKTAINLQLNQTTTWRKVLPVMTMRALHVPPGTLLP